MCVLGDAGCQISMYLWIWFSVQQFSRFKPSNLLAYNVLHLDNQGYRAFSPKYHNTLQKLKKIKTLHYPDLVHLKKRF